MSSILKANGVSHSTRLARCDLELCQGQLTMLVGPNGSGKTTLLRALARIGGATGSVSIGGRELAELSMPQRIEELSFMGASRDTVWPLSVVDYVALGLSGSDRSQRSLDALSQVEAAGFADRRIDTLSTGERTRVMLARSLAPGANVVLLDEPCANLDPHWQLAVVERLQSEAQNNAAILMSVHDLDLAIAHADRVIAMHRGQIVADGTPASALTRDIVAKVFGVEKGGDSRWRRLGA